MWTDYAKGFFARSSATISAAAARASIGLVGREADGAHAGVTAAAVALADLRQVDHLRRIGLGPGIRSHGDLGAEARLRQADGVGGLRVQVVGDELVEALERVVGDVEEDGAVALFAAARGSARCACSWRSSSGGSSSATKGWASTSASGISVSSGISRGMKAGSCVDSMIRVSFMAGAAISTAGFGALVERAVDDVGPVDQVGHRRGVEAEAGGADVGQEAGAGGVVGIEELARCRRPGPAGRRGSAAWSCGVRKADRW